jgi:hypothetical protein
MLTDPRLSLGLIGRDLAPYSLGNQRSNAIRSTRTLALHGIDMQTSNEAKRICCECVGDNYLREQIEFRGEERNCSYCDGRGETFSIGEMADEVEKAFEEHFYRTATEPSGMEYAAMKECDVGWERKGEPVIEVIEECARIEEEAATDIQKVLRDRHADFEAATMGEENPFDEDAHYAPSGVDAAEPHASWRRFEDALKTQARYFSRSAEETLASIFRGIQDHQSLFGNPVIVGGGPNTELAAVYRARVFQSDEYLEEALKRPDRTIGPPPSAGAPAGRMNARGISVFYGATDPGVALAEVRPPVGSKVVVARFEFLRPVNLLDVQRLQSVNPRGSMFDRNFIRRLERAEFLKWLSQRITMPVMPDDEPLEYLATQAVADYLANSQNPMLDGLLYASSQAGAGKLNVVLFHKAARVQPLDIPRGTSIDAQLYFDNDEGAEFYPWVTESLPRKEAPTAIRPRQSSGAPAPHPSDLPDVSDLLALDPKDSDPEQREPTVKLDAASLSVHIVERVEFKTESHSVHRHRM